MSEKLCGRKALFIAIALLASMPGAALFAAGYLGPEAIVASHDGKELYIALADAEQLAIFEIASGRIVSTIPLPAQPTGLALNANGARLYVTCAAAKSTVAVIDTSSAKIVDSIPAGHTAHGLAIAPDGKRIYVCNRFDNDVAVIEIAGHKQVARVPVTREPYAAVVTADGKTIFVANHLPFDRADGIDVAAHISAIDAASNLATAIRLPNGSSSVRGMCLSADGRYLFVVHVLSHYQLPATQVERGWINTNAMSIIDATARRLSATVLLDDIDCGAALPWGVAASSDGRAIFVSHSGTHELSRIDAPALIDHLTKLRPPVLDNAIIELDLMSHVRQRLHLPGNGPRGVAVIGNRVYATEYFSDAIAAIDFNSPAPAAAAEIAIGPRPRSTPQRRGEMLFYDATLCFQHWQSCASCHPDARADGLNWDLPNDGLGNPKNTRSLLNVFHGGSAMALGVRESASAAVRAGIEHILYAKRPEEDALAIDAYLKALSPLSSPRLVDGKLTAAAEHGKELFSGPALGCAECHPAPYYSDKRSHSVGSAGQFDKPNDRFNTPRLTESWRTAPYMHDGHYLTIRELLLQGRHGLRGKGAAKLSIKDIDDLAEFVESL